MVDWNEGYRKIGHEPLPAPTPCAATGECTPPSIDAEKKVDTVPLKFVN
jgi:hypothetical protein